MEPGDIAFAFILLSFGIVIYICSLIGDDLEHYWLTHHK